MQDGVEPVDHILSTLNSEEWNRLQKEFLK